MHVILIGNYQSDGLESMERFADMLQSEFNNVGVTTTIWRPPIIAGRLYRSATRLGKWLGYIDKFLFFPAILRIRLVKKEFANDLIRFHICDHGNAPYLQFLPLNRTVITCHDALAIRGALGYHDAFTPSSFTGKFFQKWIHHHLVRSNYIAAVSNETLKQLLEISLPKPPPNEQANWTVVHHGFNAKFRKIDLEKQVSLLSAVGIDLSRPFLLHVGSNSLRKNRKLLLDMMKALKGRWGGRICFAGDKLDNSLRSYAIALGLEQDVFSVVKPNHGTLLALYNTCEAFIFPSFSEGFGWPVIEAQACGAPVIASSIEPMPEIGGEGAIYADPNNPNEFAETFLRIRNNEELRDRMVKLGFQNQKRFCSKKMINAYLKLHGIEQDEHTPRKANDYSVSLSEYLIP